MTILHDRHYCSKQFLVSSSRLFTEETGELRVRCTACGKRHPAELSHDGGRGVFLLEYRCPDTPDEPRSFAFSARKLARDLPSTCLRCGKHLVRDFEGPDTCGHCRADERHRKEERERFLRLRGPEPPSSWCEKPQELREHPYFRRCGECSVCRREKRREAELTIESENRRAYLHGEGPFIPRSEAFSQFDDAYLRAKERERKDWREQELKWKEEINQLAKENGRRLF